MLEDSHPPRLKATLSTGYDVASFLGVPRQVLNRTSWATASPTMRWTFRFAAVAVFSALDDDIVRRSGWYGGDSAGIPPHLTCIPVGRGGMRSPLATLPSEINQNLTLDSVHSRLHGGSRSSSCCTLRNNICSPAELVAIPTTTSPDRPFTGLS